MGEGLIMLLAYILLALVALAASGCASTVDSPNGVANTSRKVTGMSATYNGALIAIDDSLRGVTCYMQGSEAISCVHTGVGRGVVER